MHSDGRYEAGDLLVAGKATEQSSPINEKAQASVATTMCLSSQHLGDGDEECRPPWAVRESFRRGSHH